MTGEDIRIRQARVEDAHYIAALSEELGYPVNQEKMEKRLRSTIENTGHALFVAEMEDGEVVGWIHAFVASYLVAESFVELGGLIVASSRRQRGIGKLLLFEVEQWAKGKRIASIRIRSRSTRKIAHDFYRKMGYKHVKTSETFSKNIE